MYAHHFLLPKGGSLEYNLKKLPPLRITNIRFALDGSFCRYTKLTAISAGNSFRPYDTAGRYLSVRNDSCSKKRRLSELVKLSYIFSAIAATLSGAPYQ